MLTVDLQLVLNHFYQKLRSKSAFSTHKIRGIDRKANLYTMSYRTTQVVGEPINCIKNINYFSAFDVIIRKMYSKPRSHDVPFDTTHMDADECEFLLSHFNISPHAVPQSCVSIRKWSIIRTPFLVEYT